MSNCLHLHISDVMLLIILVKIMTPPSPPSTCITNSILSHTNSKVAPLFIIMFLARPFKNFRNEALIIKTRLADVIKTMR